MAVIGIAGQRLGVEDDLTALGPPVGGGERGLDAELVGFVGLALADAQGLGQQNVHFAPGYFRFTPQQRTLLRQALDLDFRS